MIRSAVAFSIVFVFAAAILIAKADAQAAPIPIKACQVISQPGSYVLARNLSATGDCLVISASFVTVDLAGFSINSSQGTAISASGTSQLHGIAVRNGSIAAITE
jgi:hypothetical protein